MKTINNIIDILFLLCLIVNSLVLFTHSVFKPGRNSRFALIFILMEVTSKRRMTLILAYNTELILSSSINSLYGLVSSHADVLRGLSRVPAPVRAGTRTEPLRTSAWEANGLVELRKMLKCE